MTDHREERLRILRAGYEQQIEERVRGYTAKADFPCTERDRIIVKTADLNVAVKQGVDDMTRGRRFYDDSYGKTKDTRAGHRKSKTCFECRKTIKPNSRLDSYGNQILLRPMCTAIPLGLARFGRH